MTNITSENNLKLFFLNVDDDIYTLYPHTRSLLYSNSKLYYRNILYLIFHIKELHKNLKRALTYKKTKKPAVAAYNCCFFGKGSALCKQSTKEHTQNYNQDQKPRFRGSVPPSSKKQN